MMTFYMEDRIRTLISKLESIIHDDPDTPEDQYDRDGPAIQACIEAAESFIDTLREDDRENSRAY